MSSSIEQKITAVISPKNPDKRPLLIALVVIVLVVIVGGGAAIKKQVDHQNKNKAKNLISQASDLAVANNYKAAAAKGEQAYNAAADPSQKGFYAYRTGMYYFDQNNTAAGTRWFSRAADEYRSIGNTAVADSISQRLKDEQAAPDTGPASGSKAGANKGLNGDGL